MTFRTATNYRASFIDTQSGGLKSEFCNRVFCSWDHSVMIPEMGKITIFDLDLQDHNW